MIRLLLITTCFVLVKTQFPAQHINAHAILAGNQHGTGGIHHPGLHPGANIGAGQFLGIGGLRGSTLGGGLRAGGFHGAGLGVGFHGAGLGAGGFHGAGLGTGGLHGAGLGAGGLHGAGLGAGGLHGAGLGAGGLHGAGLGAGGLHGAGLGAGGLNELKLGAAGHHGIKNLGSHGPIRNVLGHEGAALAGLSHGKLPGVHSAALAGGQKQHGFEASHFGGIDGIAPHIGGGGLHQLTHLGNRGQIKQHSLHGAGGHFPHPNQFNPSLLGGAAGIQSPGNFGGLGHLSHLGISGGTEALKHAGVHGSLSSGKPGSALAFGNPGLLGGGFGNPGIFGPGIQGLHSGRKSHGNIQKETLVHSALKNPKKQLFLTQDPLNLKLNAAHFDNQHAGPFAGEGLFRQLAFQPTGLKGKDVAKRPIPNFSPINPEKLNGRNSYVNIRIGRLNNAAATNTNHAI